MSERHPAGAELDDFVDGTLAPSRAAQIEEHLARCERCRDDVARLRSLLAGLAALPREIEPARDLASAIRARIDELEGAPRAGRMTPRQALRTLRYPLAAAAVLLIALSSLVTTVLVRGGGDAGPAGAALAFAEFHAVEARYATAIDDLLAELDEQRDLLAPETIALIAEALRVIDEAIRESRAELDVDPYNRELKRIIMSTYEKKLDLLRQATRISARS